jgi:D-3-phosphoglycerate dehydrogenase / 2-oxoglutarate reductase
MKSKILTSPSSFGQISNKPFVLLKHHGFEVINNPFGRKLTEEEVISLGKDCIGIVAGVEPLNASVMDALPHLRCISRVGVGMDSVDLDYAKKKGIVVVNTPNGPTQSVSELALALTLSILRQIPKADNYLKQRNWKKVGGNLLLNKIIGIIGLGRIGKKTSELFRALGNPVVGHDLYPDKEWAKLNNVVLFELDRLLKEADIICLHLPSSGRPVIGTHELALMKKGSFMVNVARGGVVDEAALFEALMTGHLAGAAIDVFSEEPYSGPLCDLDNVILTPHIGSYAEEGKLQMEIDAVQNLIDVLKNE